MSRPAERGFVLVGVVMLVLALTILGISLFSISSYEAQFMGRSHDDARSLYAAQGGMEMARELLSLAPYDLEQTHAAEGVENVVHAVAWQRRSNGTLDSMGTIDFTSDSLVTIQVLAAFGRDQRLVSASFRPAVNNNFYKRLFTIANSITATSFPEHGVPDLRIEGEVWQADSSLGSDAWVGHVHWPNPPPIKRGAVPLPDAYGFLSVHTAPMNAIPIAPPDTMGTIWNIDLDPALPAPVNWYVHPLDTLTYSPFPHELDVQLDGNAVWLFPWGFRAEHIVRVHGHGRLVIVGNARAVNNYTGVCLNGGLWADSDVQVVLVSDGRVTIEHDFDFEHSGIVPHLSVYAGSLVLRSPSFDDRDQFLRYDSEMEQAVEDLLALGALPPPSSTYANAFTIVRGSWQDLTP